MLQRCALATISRQARDSSCHARKVSATLKAWAVHPFGVKGGSPSKISAIEPIP
jgi:hypothetical protein